MSTIHIPRSEPVVNVAQFRLLLFQIQSIIYGGDMPAKVRKVGKQWQCFNPDSGKVYGTHPNRASAMQQMQALYANVPDMKDEDKKEKK